VLRVGSCNCKTPLYHLGKVVAARGEEKRPMSWTFSRRARRSTQEPVGLSA